MDLHVHGSKDEDGSSTNCGFGMYTPKWLQIFASKKMYVLVYGFLGMNQTAISSYFIGTISTIEKRFNLPSSASGMIASSWDFGSLCTVLALAYFKGGGHKTRWVSACSIVAALSCYLRYLPHFLYGSQRNLPTLFNTSLSLLCNSSNAEEDDCSIRIPFEGRTTWLILMAAHIALGVGTSTYNTLGAAYLDDNCIREKAPFLLTLSICFRHVGGFLGFFLATLALNQNENPNGSFEGKDRHWVGAWYLGWIPLGSVHLFFGLLMAAFPKTLPREAKRRLLGQESDHKIGEKSSTDLSVTMKRLLTNQTLIYNVLSTTCHTLAVAGYWIFMPKYIETQFHQSPSKSSLITGSIGLVCTITGTLLSGLVISRYKPSPQYLTAWSIFTKLMDLFVHIVFIFLSCGEDPLKYSEKLAECATSCICSGKYSPICSFADQVTYFSPCHAGCETANLISKGQALFSNCSCLESSHVLAIEGPCTSGTGICNDSLITFAALLCLLKFLSFSSKAGNILIQYRSVERKDKALGIAIGEFMVCGLAFIPAPIMYGFLLDWTCLMWEDVCTGGKSNCLLYDSHRLRYTVNLMACGFFIIAIILDYGVFKNVGALNVYEEEREATEITDHYNQQAKPICGRTKKINIHEPEKCSLCTVSF